MGMLPIGDPLGNAAFEIPLGTAALVPGRPSSEMPISSATVRNPSTRPAGALPSSAGLKYAADAPPPMVPGCIPPGPSAPPVRSKRGDAAALLDAATPVAQSAQRIRIERRTV